jgi:hypothetical protein
MMDNVPTSYDMLKKEFFHKDILQQKHMINLMTANLQHVANSSAFTRQIHKQSNYISMESHMN